MIMSNVTKAEFYKVIGPLDVISRIKDSPYPYMIRFELRNGDLIGIKKCGGINQRDKFYLVKGS